MPQQAWSDKRERQYEHIKESAQDRGTGEARAEEIAARTVNKNRAQAGESDQASRTSTDDVSPQHRGGKRSHSGPGGRTKEQLYEDARRQGVRGRSTMTKQELEREVGG
ncbi:MAG TPA: plasmid stabilization protein [Pseudonocardia sp.]|jgi:plasmid stabilization system protein ParE|nr:plasmid stabilization protein [Pseudonocardia sp.]